MGNNNIISILEIMVDFLLASSGMVTSICDLDFSNPTYRIINTIFAVSLYLVAAAEEQLKLL